MNQLKKRKPVLWLLIDFFATLLLLAGIFKYMDFEIPYISDLSRPFPASMLIAFGIGITIFSMLLFLVPIIKAKHTDNEENETNPAVERTKR